MRWFTVRPGFTSRSRREVVHRRRRGMAAALVVAALLATSVSSVGSVGAAASPPRGAADPQVISDWNAVAYDTIVVDAGKQNAEAFMWFGFAQAAVYNAVVGITRQYELYNWNSRGPRGASPQAAAAVAAHDVLLEYFPASQGRLDTCAGGVPRRGSRRSAEGPGHPVRRARGRPAHRPPRGRRPQRADHVRRPACGRRLAPDPARVRAVLRPVDGTGGAAAARFAQPVPAGSASRVDLRHLHRGLQRGEGPWLVDQHGADARTDRDRAIHGASQLPAGQLLDARPGCPIPAGHQRQRTPVRGSRHERGRWPDRLLGRQIGIRLLAADHGDPAGRHRWQPGDGPGSPMGFPAADSSLSRLHQRAHHDHGRGHPRPDRSPRPRGGSHRPEHHRHGCHPPLRDRGLSSSRRPSMPGCGRASTSEPQTWSATRRARRSATGRSTTTSSQPITDRRPSLRSDPGVARLHGREGA